MSEWPQLEQRLVDSAARQRRRRWRARRLLVLAPLAGVAAAAVTLTVVSAQDRPERVPADERGVSTPAPVPTARVVTIDPKTGEVLAGLTPLEQIFGVFREPTTREDTPPYSDQQRAELARQCKQREPGSVCLRLETSRLGYRDEKRSLYLMQGPSEKDLCFVDFVEDRLGGLGCAIADKQRATKPSGSYGPPRGGKPAFGFSIFPDGVERVAYTFSDGTVEVRSVERNVVHVESEAAVTSLSWQFENRRYVQQVADPDPNNREAKRSCPQLDPLPANREPLVSTAIAAAKTLYDADVSGQARPATPADISEDRRRQCGDELAERSVLIEVERHGKRDGAVLAGVRDGRSIIWAQLE
jgi:hypothetical protein